MEGTAEKRFDDISSFYTKDRALQEEVQWLLTKPENDKNLEFVLPRLAKYVTRSVLEFGCGSGLLASQLPIDLDYHGVDKNPWFLDRARARANEKCLGLEFYLQDVRNWHGAQVDLVMAWAFLKHFGLHEWDSIVAKVLSFGQYGCLEVQIADVDLDNGTEYHHVFVTKQHLERAIWAAGHEIVECETHWAFMLPTGEPATAVAVWTRKIDRDQLPPALADADKSFQQRLFIVDEEITDLNHYSLRWADVPPQPVLYQDGRRVTKAWRLVLNVSVAADERGANANTA